MPSWALTLLLQLAPILLSAIAPFITNLVSRQIAAIGAKIPAQFMPAVNALIGAVLAGIAGANPIEGAVAAHVVRSGLAHEVPAK